MRRVATLLALVGIALACPAAALATEASSGEVRALARTALDDPAALERLRAIDRVDGRPVRIADALPAGDRDTLRARLRVLAEQTGPAGQRGPTGGTAARDAARDVLADSRYHKGSLPRPLRPVFEWIGDRFAPVWRWIQDRFSSLSGIAPGGSWTVWGLLAGALLAATAVFAARAGARRQSAASADSAAARAGTTETPANLLAAATAAEARGDLDDALRLRFRAGLLDLDRRELIELRPALTNREVLVAVGSPTLGELVEDFESVAYGGRPAATDDLREARDGWPRVPDEASSR